MKVLITGGAGFIGSHLADKLLARKDEVLVVDNYATARRDNLEPQENLRIVEGTIADTELVYRIFEEFKPDVVIHAAAAYRDPDDWAEDARTNVLGTANVMLASKRAGVNRLIYFQTALGYGLKPLEQPITINHPLKPEGSSYAISKTAGENYVELGGIDFLSFRLANAYGPRNLSGPLPTFYHRLTTDKPCFIMDTRRDFIYVEDLVAVVMKAVDGRGAPGYYHISSGTDYAIKDLFDATVKALNIKLEQEVEVRPRNPDDTETILLDPAKTNEAFDWKVTTPLETGVKRAIEWYGHHGITQTYTHLKQADEKPEAKDALTGNARA
jgi:UDP-glucose 4-epimerase